MIWLIGGIFLTAFSGVPGLFSSRTGGAGERLACGFVVLGTVSGALGVISSLLNPAASTIARMDMPWSLPQAQLTLQIDAISAFFLCPLFLVVASGSVYALRYWPQREHPGNGRKLRLFYGVICAAMMVLLTARNGILFLVAWETMALAGFFLITTEDHKREVREAGYIYLIATHSGTLALFGVFASLDHICGSLMFPAAHTLAPAGSTIIFVLALIGFGMKAGLIPLHIWLPGAHAAAPSHASALLSGVMIKTGIYGLVRLTSFFSLIPPWWGWTILLLGIISGIMGVALALAQHDIKRLLAYHSVENIGIIAMGLGLALLGRSYDVPALVALGLAGCLLHVVNHGLFKSVLFLSAGAVIHSVGSRDIDHFGGLLKRQPWVAAMFLGGAVAICGLPPFNGFISEWLIYLAAFQPLHQSPAAVAVAVVAAPALALIGALAVACFVKVFGITFLGSARSSGAAKAHAASPLMIAPMALLLCACAWIGLLPTTLAPLINDAVAAWSASAGNSGLAGKLSGGTIGTALAPLSWISLSGWLLLSLIIIVGGWLYRLKRGCAQDSCANVATWGCGYQFASARMQYTASSFADFLVRLFRFGLWSERHGGTIYGLFPNTAQFSSHTPDAILDRLLTPVFLTSAWLCRRLRTLFQNGEMAFYLLYFILTIIALLTLFIF